jgi:P4 family phage/plasmid primase-like protien
MASAVAVLHTMPLIEVYTVTLQEFFNAWIEEVHERVCGITGDADPVYVVFMGDDTACVYTASTVDNAAQSCNQHYSIVNPFRLPDGIDPNATPVHCNPAVDMSVTSFAELDGVKGAEYAELAIEDVTIGDVAKHVGEMLSNVNSIGLDELDKDIKHMQLFVDLALPDSDTYALMSFINHAIASAGYSVVLYPGVPALRHTMLEARSEMMRCNPHMYTVYKHRLLDTMLESIKEGSRSKHEMEHRVSGMVYEILFDSVVSCMGTMWCFSDGVWQECAYDGYVWKFLTNDFIEYLQSKGAEDIALYMMSTHVRSRVMKDVKLRLQDDNFYKLLDSKKSILRMENGVYDTSTEKLLGPVPSDYVSVVSGVPYQVFDYESSEVGTLMSVLGSIFPDPEVLDFFLLSCCTFLEGYNTPKVFYIWWGTGNNAKSLVQTLVMRTFGEYCSTAPTSLVTGQRSNASNATPELCHVEKRLVVFLQEPNPEEMIKAGKMKEMTGNDSMYVRQLFKSGKAITFKAKIVIVCNNIIDIPGMDAAIRRRIVVIPFTSTFLSAAEYRVRSIKGTLEPDSNIIDPSIEQQLLSCKSAFMYVLCRRYGEFRDAGFSLDIPQKIREVTEDYVTKNNHQLMFIRTFVHYLEGSAVAATEVYEMFKEWFRKSYPGKKVQDFDKFMRELCEEGHKSDGRGIVIDTYVNYAGELVN